jgi:hypothetical protein
LSLPIADASNGYAVKDIQGLDPVNASLTSSTMAQLDGAQPQNARRDPRNITMKLGLTPNYLDTLVDSLRQNLYDYVMPKANISMAFYKDGVLYAVTSGQVESFENNMFSADPEVDLSIICYDPDFYAPVITTASLETVSTTDLTTFTYPGSSDAGVIFTLNVDRDLPSIDLYNTAPDNTTQHFSMVGSFISGDVIVITSIPGQKSVQLIRGGIPTSALAYVDPAASNWITFQRGANHFRAFSSGAAIGCTLAYTVKYGGI